MKCLIKKLNSNRQQFMRHSKKLKRSPVLRSIFCALCIGISHYDKTAIYFNRFYLHFNNNIEISNFLRHIKFFSSLGLFEIEKRHDPKNRISSKKKIRSGGVIAVSSKGHSYMCMFNFQKEYMIDLLAFMMKKQIITDRYKERDKILNDTSKYCVDNFMLDDKLDGDINNAHN